MTCHYPYLGSQLLIGLSKFLSRHDQSEALSARSGWWRVISMEFLRSFLWRHFGWNPVVTLRNVGRLLVSMCYMNFILFQNSYPETSGLSTRQQNLSPSYKKTLNKDQLSEKDADTVPGGGEQAHFPLSGCNRGYASRFHSLSAWT